jgi:hypothetical protein
MRSSRWVRRFQRREVDIDRWWPTSAVPRCPYTRGIRISQAQLAGNDKDFQGGALTVTAVSDASGGTVSIEGGGTGDIIFTPAPGFEGIYGFKYTIKDAQNNLAAQVVDLSSGETAKARWRIPNAVVIPAGDCGRGGIRPVLADRKLSSGRGSAAVASNLLKHSKGCVRPARRHARAGICHEAATLSEETRIRVAACAAMDKLSEAS